MGYTEHVSYKISGLIWLCGDYKLTANKAVSLDRYPLPLAEE